MNRLRFEIHEGQVIYATGRPLLGLYQVDKPYLKMLIKTDVADVKLYNDVLKKYHHVDHRKPIPVGLGDKLLFNDSVTVLVERIDRKNKQIRFKVFSDDERVMEELLQSRGNVR